MEKLIGQNKYSVAVFISGTGSNLKNLIRFSLQKNSPIKIDLVLSNNSTAKCLLFAKKYRIKKMVSKFQKQSTDENNILIYLKKNNIKLICLAGFMKVLSSNFIKKFNGIILNIHPSLLPKYKGLNTHEKVIRNKEKFSGCTVHFVNSKLDSGKIILQKKVSINKQDTPKSLAKKVLKQEHILYPKALIKVLSNL